MERKVAVTEKRAEAERVASDLLNRGYQVFTDFVLCRYVVMAVKEESSEQRVAANQ